MGELGEYWRDVDAYFKDRAINPQKYFTKKEIDAYNKRVAKRAKKREETSKNLEMVLSENGVVVKKYSNGQWTLNDVIDWWITTGTAINRKTRERYHFTEAKPLEIIKALQEDNK